MRANRRGQNEVFGCNFTTVPPFRATPTVLVPMIIVIYYSSHCQTNTYEVGATVGFMVGYNINQPTFHGGAARCLQLPVDDPKLRSPGRCCRPQSASPAWVECDDPRTLHSCWDCLHMFFFYIHLSGHLIAICSMNIYIYL
jgi:hypothetical protein